MNLEKKNIKGVTYLKGIAIFMIIIVHYAQRFFLPTNLREVCEFGQMGCQIFLLLSSFTLCLSYEREKPDYKNFMKKRLLRLGICYWTIIIVQAVLRVVTGKMLYNQPILEALNLKGILINGLFLHGLSFDFITTNGIVMGGWYIGTIFVLYLLFPFLYKFYKYIENKYEKGFLIFPGIIFVISSLILIVISIINPAYACENNNVIYFSFINQITCYSLGFSLYYLYKSDKVKEIKFPLIKAILSIFISFEMFFTRVPNIFVLIPTVFGIGTIYLFVFINKYKELPFENVINKFGNLSYHIYLTHFYIVYTIFKDVVIIIGNDERIFKLFLPIVFISTYFLGKMFNWYEQKIRKVLKLK